MKKPQIQVEIDNCRFELLTVKERLKAACREVDFWLFQEQCLALLESHAKLHHPIYGDTAD